MKARSFVVHLGAAIVLASTGAVALPPLAGPAAALTPPAPPAPVTPAPYQREVTTAGPTRVGAGSGYVQAQHMVWGPQGSPYIVSGGFGVPQYHSLTLLPGTVIKLEANAHMLFDGALYSLGTPANRVTITSAKDDAAGGDSNGDGATSAPARGDWIGLLFKGGVGLIKYTDVRFGGAELAGWDRANISSYGYARLAVSHSRITESSANGMHSKPNDDGYVGVFDSEFDNLSGSGFGTQDSSTFGPNVLMGNTFGSGIERHAISTYFRHYLVARYNTIRTSISIEWEWSGSITDIRFNTVYGNIWGNASATWWGRDLNTEELPTCMTKTEMDAYRPRLAARTFVPGVCDAVTYFEPAWANPSVLPALTGAPGGVPASVHEAASARYANVDTGRGHLRYSTGDLTVLDAGKALTAERIHRSDRAGQGWSTSFSESLSTLQGISSLSLPDGSSLPFATDPVAGYVPANGVVAGFSTGPDGSSVTGTDQVAYQFNAAGELTAILLGDPGHRASVQRANGQLAKVTGVSGRYLSYERADGKLAAIVDSQGRRVNFTYTDNRLTAVSGVDGQTETYQYDAAGRLTRVTAPSGLVRLAVDYGADGKVAWLEEPGRGRSTFSYDAGARTTTITRADNSQIVHVLDEHGRLSAEQTVGGSARHLFYDASGRVIAKVEGTPGVPMTGFGPAASTTLFNERGDAAVTVNPAQENTIVSYDSAHRPLVSRFADGSRVTRVYNGDGRMESITDQVGKVSSYTYNGHGQVLTQVNPLAQTRTLAYEADGDLASIADASGATTSYEYDAHGWRSATTDARGHRHTATHTAWGAPLTQTIAGQQTEQREFDVDRRLVASVDPLGNRTRIEYDAAGRLSAMVDALGQRTTTEYDPLGRATRTVDPRGAVRLVGYSPDGFVISQTGPAGDVTAIGRDPLGQAIRVTDAGGVVTQFTYSHAGPATKIELPDGAVQSYKLDRLGRALNFTDGRGKVTAYQYDTAGRMLKLTDANGYTRLWAYDALGRLEKATDELGQVTTLSYNDSARRVTVADSIGTAAIIGFDAVGQPVSETDGSGRVTAHEYYPNGKRAATVAPGGARTEYQYDAAGRLTHITDPLTRQTVLERDALDRVTRVTDAAGHALRYDYEPGGEVSAFTDRSGRRWQYAHDSRGLLTTVTNPAGKQTTIDHDSMGRRTRVTDPTGVQRNFAYDPLGRVAVEWDTIGASTVTKYDLAGNLAERTGPDGVIWSHGYNARNELTSVYRQRNWLYSSVTFGYDRAGNLTSHARPDVPAETFTYDQRGHMSTSTFSDGKVTTYTHDGAGHPTSTTTPSGKASRWTYDAAGRMETAIDPLGNTSRYEHDAAGQLRKLTLPRGGTYEYTYDPLGAVASEKDPNGRVTAWVRDEDGRLTATTPPSGAGIEIAYDLAGRLQRTSAAGVTRTLGYDDAGRITSASVAGGPSSSFTYDNRGLLATSTDHIGQTNFTRDDAGRIRTVTSPSGQQTTYSYYGPSTVYSPGVGQLETVRGAVNANYGYAWDRSLTKRQYVAPSAQRYDGMAYDNGRLKQNGPLHYTYTDDGQVATVFNQSSGKTTHYTYDDAGRLTNERVAEGETTLSSTGFGWDEDGNRTGAGDVTYTYDQAGQLLSSSDGKTYGYDLDGNLTTNGETSLTYNGFGELSAAGPVSYERDALGRTTSRTAGSVTQSFGYAGKSGDISASRSAGSPIVDVIRGHGGEVLGQATAGGERQRPRLNQHDDVLSWENDQTAAVTAELAYDAFGRITSSSGVLPAVTFGYQSSLFDAGNGLVDMKFRAYDPASGRFTARDNIAGAYGRPVSLNRYAYGNADPVNHVDPDGHWPQWLDNFARNWVNEFKAGLSAEHKSSDPIARFLNGAIEKAGSEVLGALRSGPVAKWRDEFNAGWNSPKRSDDGIARFLNAVIEKAGEGFKGTLQLGTVAAQCGRKGHEPSCQAIKDIFTWGTVEASWNDTVDPMREVARDPSDSAKWGALAGGIFSFLYGGKFKLNIAPDVPGGSPLPSKAPDGGSPAPDVVDADRAGTAIVYWNGFHAAVEVRHGDRSVISHQAPNNNFPRGSRRTTGELLDREGLDERIMPEMRIGHEFPLSNAKYAMAYQESTPEMDLDVYDIDYNSCITYCLGVLYYGGKRFPGDDTADKTKSLKTILENHLYGQRE